MSEHGYAMYSSKPGCRCEVCRKAKADYMRARRAAGRAVAQKYTSPNPGTAGATSSPKRYVADIESHGTRYGYEEKGCRCLECTYARTDSDRRYKGKGRES